MCGGSCSWNKNKSSKIVQNPVHETQAKFRQFPKQCWFSSVFSAYSPRAALARPEGQLPQITRWEKIWAEWLLKIISDTTATKSDIMKFKKEREGKELTICQKWKSLRETRLKVLTLKTYHTMLIAYHSLIIESSRQ